MRWPRPGRPQRPEPSRLSPRAAAPPALSASSRGAAGPQPFPSRSYRKAQDPLLYFHRASINRHEFSFWSILVLAPRVSRLQGSSTRAPRASVPRTPWHRARCRRTAATHGSPSSVPLPQQPLVPRALQPGCIQLLSPPREAVSTRQGRSSPGQQLGAKGRTNPQRGGWTGAAAGSQPGDTSL